MHVRTYVVAFACGLTIATGAAAAPLVPLDTEQKAAQAVVVAQQLRTEAPGYAGNIYGDAITIAEGALRSLKSTTPAELARTPGGVTFACARGGSVTARSTGSVTRVVDLELQACRPFQSIPYTATGPLRLTLLSNSFTFEAFAGLRAGNKDRDLVTSYTVGLPGETITETYITNMVMQGYIAWPTHVTTDLVPDTSLFEVNGFMSYTARNEIPGQYPVVSTQRFTAEHLLASTSIAYGSDFAYSDERFTYFLGAVAQEFFWPNGVRTQRHEFAGLSYRRIIDFATWTESLEIDGGIRYQWLQPAAAGCQSGGYLFDTRTPLVRNLDFERFDSGELIINRTVNARFFSAENVPGGMPVPSNGMLTHLEVKNVGSFDYDTASPWLGSVAQCP